MKYKYSFLTTFFLLIVTFNLQGQCPYDNTFYTDMTPSSAGDTQTSLSVWAGDYVTVNVIMGETYTFSTCNDASGEDTQLSLYADTGINILVYDDDGCGSGSVSSLIIWTATFTGTVHLLLDSYDINFNDCSHSNVNVQLEVTWETSLSVEDTIFSEDLLIYPNPNNGTVKVDLRSFENVTLKVFNIEGKLIFEEKNIHNQLVDFELKTESGIYFLELSSEGGKKAFKIIKE